MRVMVTGGTGFVGAHTVKALLDAGHEVNLLVRSPDRIKSALEPLGITEDIPFTVGDVIDSGSVEKAMDGCDAVVHAASVYSFDVRQAANIRNTNVTGTDTVLGTAYRSGKDPIVYVSSVVALVPPEGEVLTPESPVKNPPGVYIRSKADAERVARDYQAQGAPVAITYPGAVWGPHDPHWGEGPQTIVNILKNPLNTFPPGGIPIVDVRDVANIHAALMEPGKGSRRYMASGNYNPVGDLTGSLSTVTGNTVRLVTMPAWSLLPVVQLAQFAQNAFRIRLPINREVFDLAKWDLHCDDSSTIGDLGIKYRNTNETVSDMIRWMHQTGGLSSKLAGKAAS